jgi:hypothetical protein
MYVYIDHVVSRDVYLYLCPLMGIIIIIIIRQIFSSSSWRLILVYDLIDEDEEIVYLPWR